MLKTYFISIEGIDGGGKSTQVKLLTASFLHAGLKALSTREPGGTPNAEAIRQLILSSEITAWQPKTELLLHMAARSEHLASIIKPALKEGCNVICDRFIDSSFVYQGYGLGINLDEIKQIYNLIAGNFWPDLTLILDLSMDNSLKRIDKRNATCDRYEAADLAFRQRLQSGFRDLAQLYPKRCKLIDANLTSEEIHLQIINLVNQELAIGLNSSY